MTSNWSDQPPYADALLDGLIKPTPKLLSALHLDVGQLAMSRDDVAGAISYNRDSLAGLLIQLNSKRGGPGLPLDANNISVRELFLRARDFAASHEWLTTAHVLIALASRPGTDDIEALRIAGLLSELIADVGYGPDGVPKEPVPPLTSDATRAMARARLLPIIEELEDMEPGTLDGDLAIDVIAPVLRVALNALDLDAKSVEDMRKAEASLHMAKTLVERAAHVYEKHGSIAIRTLLLAAAVELGKLLAGR